MIFKVVEPKPYISTEKHIIQIQTLFSTMGFFPFTSYTHWVNLITSPGFVFRSSI